eukprot:2606754-Pleurochrysis_carterae.AAC.7
MQQKQASAPCCVRIATASASGLHAPGAALATCAWARCACCSKCKHQPICIRMSRFAGGDSARNRAVFSREQYNAGRPIWRSLAILSGCRCQTARDCRRKALLSHFHYDDKRLWGG